MITFIHGMNTMGFSLAGLYFLRFWTQTRDVFFVLFAVAFWLFAVNYLVDLWFDFNPGAIIIYLLRLAGFALIIIAILSKNVTSAR